MQEGTRTDTEETLARRSTVSVPGHVSADGIYKWKCLTAENLMPPCKPGYQATGHVILQYIVGLVLSSKITSYLVDSQLSSSNTSPTSDDTMMLTLNTVWRAQQLRESEWHLNLPLRKPPTRKCHWRIPLLHTMEAFTLFGLTQWSSMLGMTTIE